MARFIPIFRPIYLILVLTLMLIAGTSTGEILTIDEDFSSTSMRDEQMTTAFWDTTSLNVHLYSQILFSRGTLNTTAAYMSVLGPTHLFLADGTAGLRSINIDDPDNPSDTDVIACASTAKRLALSGDHAFVAVGSAGMQVINVANPAVMVDHGSFDNSNDLGFVNAVAVHEPAVYLAESDGGVAVFNINNPTDPVFVQHLDTGSWARDVHVSGDYLYVADEGLKIFDLSNPLNPTLVSSTPIIGTVLRITVTANKAYVACGSSGLFIFDLDDPSNPIEISAFNEWASCQHATATDSGDTVFVAASFEGLYLLDATDPADIKVLDSSDTFQSAVHVMHHNDLIYLSNVSDGLKIFEINSNGLDPERNLAQSINLNDMGDPVSRVNLTAAITDSVGFQVTANGGTTWHTVQPDEGWFVFPESGSDVRWRAYLVETDESPEAGPACHGLSISMDRLSSFGTITSVNDVPNDSGLQVRLSWQASRHDTQGAEHVITEYSIYRRYQGTALKANQPSAPYPPGQWDFVTTIPADMETQYACVVPTLADSNSTGVNWTPFFIRTRTSVQGEFFDSPPDSGYSVNNLLPDPPTGWMVDYSPPDGTQLSWDSPSNPQFAHFRVYRSSQLNTPVQPATLFAVTTETNYFDDSSTHWYYQLTLVTLDGTESLPAYFNLSSTNNPQPVIQMRSNVPNPFNPITTIHFETGPNDHPLHLEIFDTRGRKIRSFMGLILEAGPHQVRWDGRDNSGRNCASGVYHARLRQGTAQQVMKMTLVR